MRTYLALTSLALLVTACAAPQPLNAIQNDALIAPTCKDKSTCDLYWQRAQIWVSQHSSWRIQTANETIIQTFGPGNKEITLAYTITKIPDGKGGASITYQASCDNIFGCEMRPVDAFVSLKRFITTGQ